MYCATWICFIQANCRSWLQGLPNQQDCLIKLQDLYPVFRFNWATSLYFDLALLNTLCHTCYGTWCIRLGSHRAERSETAEELRIVMCNANANTMWGVTACKTSALGSSARFTDRHKQGVADKVSKALYCVSSQTSTASFIQCVKLKGESLWVHVWARMGEEN